MRTEETAYWQKSSLLRYRTYQFQKIVLQYLTSLLLANSLFMVSPPAEPTVRDLCLMSPVII